MTTRRTLLAAITGLLAGVAAKAKTEDYEPHLSPLAGGGCVVWRVTRRWEPDERRTKVSANTYIDGKRYGLAIAYTPDDLARFPEMVGTRFRHLRESLDWFIKNLDDPRVRKHMQRG